MTRRKATLAAALMAGGTTAAARRRRAAAMRWTPAERGMCFRMASFNAVDCGRHEDRVVL